MNAKIKKMLKLMSELQEVDQFILDYYKWMSEKQIDDYTKILQETKKERIKEENKFKSLFLRMA